MAEEESFTPSEPLAMEENFTHWSRFVEVPFGETRTIAVEQDPDSFILGTTVWDSSKTLLKFIEQHANIFQQFTSICELGAGCGGLAGISCAINNKGLSDVVMTDIAPVLPWLKQNVSANLSEKELERVQIKKYIWGKPINDLNGPFGKAHTQ
jgi:predicted RNA methylase